MANIIWQGTDGKWRIEDAEKIGLFEPVESMVNAYNKAISEKANDVDYFADAYLNLGALLFHAPGKRDEAVSLIKKSLERKKSLPSAYNFLAIDAATQEDYDRAEKLFALALKYDPDNTGYQKNLHICQKLSDRKKRSLKK